MFNMHAKKITGIAIENTELP